MRQVTAADLAAAFYAGNCDGSELWMPVSEHEAEIKRLRKALEQIERLTGWTYGGSRSGLEDGS